MSLELSKTKSFYKVAKNLAELYSSAESKAEYIMMKFYV